MKARSFTILASLLVLVIFGGLNIAAQNWLSGARADMTENRLFTLSDAARDVAQGVAEPVRLEFVYSRRLAADYPDIRAYGARVRELLQEIAARSDGGVQIVQTDPAPFTDDEDRVLEAGLTSLSTESGDPLYFGVIGRNSVDDQIVIPFLSPERETLLEYDLVKMISRLDDPAPPRIGVLTSLRQMAGRGKRREDFYILREMARSYQIVQINPGFAALPADLDALLIVHPPELSPRQQYLIDQYLLRVGRAVIAIDPASKSALATRGRRARLGSDLGAANATMGLGSINEVVIDRDIGLPVERIEGGRRIVESQPLFMAPVRALMSDSDPVTTDLSRPLNFGAAGRLRVTPSAGAVFEPLIWTTPEAALISPQTAGREVTPRELLANYTPLGEAQVLAGRLSGHLTSAFAADAIPAEETPDDPVLAQLQAAEAVALPHLTSSEQDAQIILLADADVFDDSFYVSPNGGAPVADNAVFLLNALDNLAGSQALVHLRSRAASVRSMLRVDAMRDAAQARLYEEQANLEARLQQTEARLEELRTSGAGGGLLAGPGSDAAINQAQAAEMARFRSESIEIRERLREVEREFRADIVRLEGRLAFLNIWAPPLVVALLGFLVVGWRARRKGRG